MEKLGIDGRLRSFEQYKKPYYQEHAGEEEEKSPADKALADDSHLPKDFFQRDLIKKLRDDAKVYKNDSHSQGDLLCGMPGQLKHTLDFSMFHHEAVYRYINQLADQNELAGVDNESLTKQLKVAISKFKENHGWELPE